MSDGSIKGISRRQVLGGSVAVAVGAALGSPGDVDAQQARGQAAAAAQPDELVFVNGRIHTMDPKNTVATTVSIRNGRFVAVGGAAPRPAAGRANHRPARPHGGARHHRQPQPHRADGQPARLPHAARERDVDSRTCRRSSPRAPPRIRRGAWITTIGGFHRNQLVLRRPDAAPAHAGGARRGGRRTTPCTSRRGSTGRRPRTAWARSSSRARLRRFRSAPTARSRPARRPRAARRWRCGRRCSRSTAEAAAAPSTR